ncbi:MAG: YggT family protein, partial [bacterium]
EWIIIIAILVSWLSPDPANPIIQFLNRMTRPVWDYLAVRLPKALRLFSAYISLLMVWFLKVFLPGSLGVLAGFSAGEVGFGEVPVRVTGFFLLGGSLVAKNLLYFLILLLLVWFFLTLVSPSVNNPIVRTIFFLVDPFITPLQKRLPRMKVDISPLLVAGLFLVCNILLVTQLMAYSAGLAHYSGGQPFSRPVPPPERGEISLRNFPPPGRVVFSSAARSPAAAATAPFHLALRESRRRRGSPSKAASAPLAAEKLRGIWATGLGRKPDWRRL